MTDQYYRCNSCGKRASIDDSECSHCGGVVKPMDELIDEVGSDVGDGGICGEKLGCCCCCCGGC